MAVSPEAYAIIQQKKAKYCRLADTQQWDIRQYYAAQRDILVPRT